MLVQNRKENCHHDHIPFNVKRNGNIVFSVQRYLSEFIPMANIQSVGSCKSSRINSIANLIMLQFYTYQHSYPGYIHFIKNKVRLQHNRHLYTYRKIFSDSFSINQNEILFIILQKSMGKY